MEVRVVAFREPAMGPRDLQRTRVAPDAEHRVGIQDRAIGHAGESRLRAKPWVTDDRS
jgi:hypothetical protein